MLPRTLAVGGVMLVALVAFYSITRSWLYASVGTVALGTLMGLTLVATQRIGVSWSKRTRILVMVSVAALVALLSGIELVVGSQVRGVVGGVTVLVLLLGATLLRSEQPQSHSK